MDIENLVAIDVHTHAEVSQRIPEDPAWKAMQEASAGYFKDAGPRPTVPEVAAYYRERKMACVIFPVDMESTTGQVRVPNEEVAEVAAQNSDVLIPFASIDPAKGKMGAQEARRLIEHFGVRGFKFHPPLQAFYPNDRKAYVIYEVIAEAGICQSLWPTLPSLGRMRPSRSVCTSPGCILISPDGRPNTFRRSSSSMPTPSSSTRCSLARIIR